MKKLHLLFLGFVGTFHFSFAQNIDLPEEDFNISVEYHQPYDNPGFSKTNSNSFATQRGALDPELEDTLQGALDAYLSQIDVVGLSASVHVEEDSWSGATGINTGIEPMTTDILFAVGSVSKTFTMACIMSMYEDNLLQLDDPIDDYLPSYEYVDSLITIRQLLNHTSGIYNYTNHPNFGDSLNADLARIWTPQELMNNFVNSPYFLPGANWTYSNTNYVLLGLIIEEISGNPYHEEVRTRLIDPLNLNTVALYPQESLNGDYANIWFDITGTGNIVDFYSIGGTLDALFSAAWAAGAYVATPEEAALWVKALYGGDLLQQSSLDEIQMTIPFGIDPIGYQGYGLGTFELGTFCSDENAWGHGGDIVYSSQDYYFPGEDIAIAVHCNDGSVNSNNLLELVDELHCIVTGFISTSNQELSAEDFDYLAFPNPFDESVSITYNLEEKAKVEIIVYNALGQHLATLLSEDQYIGEHTLNWFTKNSGLYFIKFKIDGAAFTQRLIKY